jgi:hypothetical protein
VPVHYLFGPVSATFADQNLRPARQAGDCLAFNATGSGVDLAIAPSDTWDDVAARLPANWVPDCVALWLPYAAVPAALWAAPVPLIGFAADWNLLWHVYRHILPRCDLVLTDRPGVDVLSRAGIRHARPACLFGLEHDFLSAPVPDSPRDIDILFVGNLHPAVQRERLPWLARLARLSARCAYLAHCLGVRDEAWDAANAVSVSIRAGRRLATAVWPGSGSLVEETAPNGGNVLFFAADNAALDSISYTKQGANLVVNYTTACFRKAAPCSAAPWHRSTGMGSPGRANLELTTSRYCGGYWAITTWL